MNTYINWMPPFWPIFLKMFTNDPEVGCIAPNSLTINSIFCSTGLILEPTSKLIQSLALFLTLFSFNRSSFLLARFLELFTSVGDVGFDDHAGEVAAIHDLHAGGGVSRWCALQISFLGSAAYLHALISSYSISIPYACYAINLLIEENNVGDFAHLGAFFSDVFFDVEDGCWVFL